MFIFKINHLIFFFPLQKYFINSYFCVDGLQIIIPELLMNGKECTNIIRNQGNDIRNLSTVIYA